MARRAGDYQLQCSAGHHQRLPATVHYSLVLHHRRGTTSYRVHYQPSYRVHCRVLLAPHTSLYQRPLHYTTITWCREVQSSQGAGVLAITWPQCQGPIHPYTIHHNATKISPPDTRISSPNKKRVHQIDTRHHFYNLTISILIVVFIAWKPVERRSLVASVVCVCWCGGQTCPPIPGSSPWTPCQVKTGRYGGDHYHTLPSWYGMVVQGCSNTPRPQEH